jgi:hypothetical protein
VAQTPEAKFDNTLRLRDFINQNQTAILTGKHVVPPSFQAAPFRAGAIVNNIDFWAAPGIVNNDARQIFSLNTCNGCHGGETNTFFLQVSPRIATQPAALSGFLTGVTLPDPVSGKSRSFNDLARRVRDLRTLACPAVAPALLPEDALIGARVD